MRAGAKIDHAGILRAKRRPPACSDYLGAALELIRTGEANGGQIRIEDGCLVIAPDEVAKASARTRSHLMLVAGASAVRRHDRGAVAHQHWRAGALDAGRMVRGGAACSCEAVDRGAVCHAAIGRILGEVSAGTGPIAQLQFNAGSVIARQRRWEYRVRADGDIGIELLRPG